MTRKADLSGRKFGLLTVVNEASHRFSASGRKQVMWNCICDCGGFALIAANNLLSGNSETCGCGKRTAHRRIDLSGMKFGRLTVVSYKETNKLGHAIWNCVCDCGNSTTAKTMKLRRGKVSSCGCYRSEGRFHRGIGPVKWARIIKHGVGCLKCGATSNLHAHHIVPVSADKSLSRSCFNGECLCASCHSEFHGKYGKESAGIQDFADFCGIGEKETTVIDILINSKGRQDIEKAIHELQLLLELRYRADEVRT